MEPATFLNVRSMPCEPMTLVAARSEAGLETIVLTRPASLSTIEKTYFVVEAGSTARSAPA